METEGSESSEEKPMPEEEGQEPPSPEDEDGMLAQLEEMYGKIKG
jgi:hypothetical protein